MSTAEQQPSNAERLWTDPQCPLARAVDLVGDRWVLLILRDVFTGVRRYTQLHRSLGIARNILTVRLQTLVNSGILTVQPATDGTKYQEYVLTDRGEDLFTAMVALRQWGEKHAFAAGEQHSRLLETSSGRALPPLYVLSASGMAITSTHTHVEQPVPIPTGR
ncbi:transcriptional regulator [Kineococcus sp. T13]|uniref:winged helix-turn-helix transcriptional regulator n=1 Tax=Kineococcus vitellinus TaxID=2696565 RepID=UPI001412909A|nr:helix-turn-helix domain-containing protein [Kineococcus vitellinus]NAZ74691.1 transcriptional regulator [Kineococcus vitellinus]